MIGSNAALPFKKFLPIYNWIYPLTAHKSKKYNNERRSEVFRSKHIANAKSRALYFHIPFCDTICSFCPFVRGQFTSRDVIENYTNALISEINIKAPLINPEVPIKAIFFGGGTPSLLDPSQIQRIGLAIHRNFNLRQLREFSFEFEAKSVHEEALHALREIGVTHARFGLQTFNSKYRDLFTLTATTDQIYRASELLGSGFEYASCDILYGMHGHTTDEFLEDVAKASKLNLTNIDFYPINNTVTQNKLHTSYKQLGLKPTSSMVKFYMNSTLREVMHSNGYLPHNGHGYFRVQPEEIDRNPVVTDSYSFVYHEHVYGYEHHDVIGFGVNAVTSASGFTVFNEPNREKYSRDLLKNNDWQYTVCEHSETIDAARPLALRLPYHGFVDSDLVRWDLIPTEIKDSLGAMIDKGLVHSNGNALRLTKEGWRWYVNIMHALLPSSERTVLEGLIKKSVQKRSADFEEMAVDGHA